MMRVILVIIPYLLVALAIEMAIIPQAKTLAGGFWQQLLDLRFLAMAGILVGLIVGEIPALFVAFVAALLFGFAQIPGTLGASIVSFGVAAWLAGWLMRRVRIQSFGAVWLWLAILLFAERFLWLIVRLVFFPNTSVAFTGGSLLGLVVTALLGALLFRVASPRLKRNRLFDEDDAL